MNKEKGSGENMGAKTGYAVLHLLLSEITNFMTKILKLYEVINTLFRVFFTEKLFFMHFAITLTCSTNQLIYSWKGLFSMKLRKYGVK